MASALANTEKLLLFLYFPLPSRRVLMINLYMFQNHTIKPQGNLVWRQENRGKLSLSEETSASNSGRPPRKRKMHTPCNKQNPITVLVE